MKKGDQVQFRDLENLQDVITAYGRGPFLLSEISGNLVHLEFKPSQELMARLEWIEPYVPPHHPTIDKKLAYEQNKTRDFCIRCGAPTEARPLFGTVIQFCRCVE